MKHVTVFYKAVSCLLSVMLVGTSVMAQDINSKLLQARNRQQADVDCILSQIQSTSFAGQDGEEYEVDVAKALKMLAWTASAGFAAVAAKHMVKAWKQGFFDTGFNYHALNDKAWQQIKAVKLAEIRQLEQQIKEDALKRYHSRFSLSELGEDNLRFLNEVMRRNVEEVGIPLPQIYYEKPQLSLSAYLENRGKEAIKIFIVKPEKEMEFGRKVLSQLKRYKRFSYIKTLPLGESVLEYVSPLGISKRLSQEIYYDMLCDNIFRDCIEEISAEQAYKKMTFNGRYIVVGKYFLSIRNVVSIVAAGALLGAMSWTNKLSEQEIMARVEENPALFFNLSDEDLKRIEKSEKLTNKYMEFCDHIHEIASLSSDDLHNMFQQSHHMLQQEKALAKQHIIREIEAAIAR